MTLRLEAISVPDGVGIVRIGSILRLIRPPYLHSNSPVLSEDSLQEAILKGDFSASRDTFQDWEALIQFLDSKVVEYRKQQGRSIPSLISGKDIIDVAPPEVVSRFLDRVESELIPQRLFDHAETILLALLANQSILSRPIVAGRAAGLFKTIKEARATSSMAINKLARCDTRFTSLKKHKKLEQSNKLAETIRARGCVFEPVS